MRFDDRVTGRLDKYAKQAKIIHLDIDPSEIDKNVKADVGVWGDCKETLPLLTLGIEQKDHSEWLAVFADYTKQEYEQCIEIRNLIQKIKNKKLSSKVSKKEKLILMKLSPVMREE